MDLRTTGMEFASEMVIKSTLAHMKIAETATTLNPDGRSRPPHLRPWRDGWRHLRFMLLYSPQWLFVVPGLALMLIGLTMCALLLPGSLRLGAVTLSVNTMMFATLAVLVGFASVSFGVFTKIFAVGEGLLPPDPRLSRLFEYVTLEVGLVLGLIFLCLGAVGTTIAVANWYAVDFGPLSTDRVTRLVIPSALCLALGVQIVLTSFFVSVLGLRTRTYAVK